MVIDSDVYVSLTQRAHNIVIMSLLCLNDIVTSFWRNNNIIMALCVRLEAKLTAGEIHW